MSSEDFIEYISNKITPYSLTETDQASLARLFRKYSESLLLECVEIGIEQYFRYDDNGSLTHESVSIFLDKLGGIAFNKSKSPIEQSITHINNLGKKTFSHWNDPACEDVLHDYVCALQRAGWSDHKILDDLQREVVGLFKRTSSWSSWRSKMNGWITDINNWSCEDVETIESSGTIIPDIIAEGLPAYAQKLIKQINASYENNLFDCCAVMMRRLLEVLLVLSFQKAQAEDDIMDKSGKHHVTLDKIIQIAANSQKLSLSSNVKTDMRLFKDLGNFSAHKIWYNCTQQDIKPHSLKYRIIIEELLYKSGLK